MRRFLVLLLVAGGLLAGCGRVITLPTPTPTPLRETATAIALKTPTGTATPTPAPYTPAPTDTPTVTPTPIFYEVQAGDTLLGIAHRYGISLAALQEANGIIDPRSLQVGQRLVIPREALVQSQGTPVPTPTPVPAKPRGVHFARLPHGGLWCMGEVVNPENFAIEDVQLRVDLMDGQGNVVAERETSTEARVIPAGGKAPFVVSFPNAYPKFTSYRVVLLRALRAHQGRYYPDVTVVGASGEPLDTGLYGVRGNVENRGPEEAVDVVVVATLYDALGNVIGVRSGPPQHNVIPPGGKSAFKMEITPGGGPVITYTLQAEALRLPTPTPME